MVTKQSMSSDTAAISYGVCQETVTENMNMLHTAVKFVPRLLTNDQKQRITNVSWGTREGWGGPNFHI
jgi:hypothetical protein